jgi:branched-chain amino acid transport system permease protein
MLVGGLLIAVLAGLPLVGPSTYVLGFLLLLFMYAALAASWNIVGGFTGYLSFGHAAFFGLGAYTTAMLLFYLGWSPFLTFPLAGALAAGFALVVGYPCLRLRGPYFSLITLMLALALNTLVLNLPFTQGATGLFLPFPPVDIYTNHVIFYEAMLGLMLLATLTLRWIDRSKLGVGLAAIRADEDVAQALGVNATGLKLLAFVLSAFLTGMVGGIFAYYQSFLDPTFVFATAISINIALMALFGGRGSWLGPLLGAAVLTLVNELLVVSVGAQPARIAFGLLLMLVILFMPEGLMALVPAVVRRLH